jgi:hypothetical protein
VGPVVTTQLSTTVLWKPQLTNECDCIAIKLFTKESSRPELAQGCSLLTSASCCLKRTRVFSNNPLRRMRGFVFQSSQ